MQVILYSIEIYKKNIYFSYIKPVIGENYNQEKKREYETLDDYIGEEVDNVEFIYDLNEIKKFINNHKKDHIFIGYNNNVNDDFILHGIIKDYQHEQLLTLLEANQKQKNKYTGNLFFNFDLYNLTETPLSVINLYYGNALLVNKISKDQNHKHNKNEINSVKHYLKYKMFLLNDIFNYHYADFKTRLLLINWLQNPPEKIDNTLKNNDYFYLLNSNISAFSKYFLNVKTKPNKNQTTEQPPLILKNVKLEENETNKKVLDFFLNQDFKTKQLSFNINGVEHKIGQGGIHGARSKDQPLFINNLNNKKNEVLTYHLDIKKYYANLITLFNFYPSNFNEENKKRYKNLLHTVNNEEKDLQTLKKYYSDFDYNQAFKDIKKLMLNSVYGAMNSNYSAFYDYYNFNNIIVNGQLFIIDLLEKLDPFIYLINNNTDGVIFQFNKKHKNEINDVLYEWKTRTGLKFTIKEIKKLYQKDVNNYCYLTKDGHEHLKGSLLKYLNNVNKGYKNWDYFCYKSKTPLIVSIATKNILFYSDFETLKYNLKKDELAFFYVNMFQNTRQYFQFIAYKNKFNNLILEENESFYYIGEACRFYPLNINNEKNKNQHQNVQTIYKVRYENDINNGVISSKQKINNAPANIFLFNSDIIYQSEETTPKKAFEDLKTDFYNKIDLEYYANLINEKVKEYRQYV